MDDISSVMKQDATIVDPARNPIPTNAALDLLVQPGGEPAASSALRPRAPDNVTINIREFK